MIIKLLYNNKSTGGAELTYSRPTWPPLTQTAGESSPLLWRDISHLFSFLKSIQAFQKNDIFNNVSVFFFKFN